VNRARRAVWPFVVSVAVVGVLFLLVFPARTYVAQRRSLVAVQTKVKVLTTENKTLDDRVTALQQPSEIERMAREQYGMVKPGEEAFAILPTPAPPAPATPAKPAEPHRTVIQRAWHAIF
jgi:cell division protein FtsB